MKRLAIYLILFTVHCSLLAPTFPSSGSTASAGIAADPASQLNTARHLGLGGATLAFSDDATGIFHNPAGLANVHFPQVTASSRKLVLDETQYSLLCWALPTPWGALGFGYSGYSTGGSLPTIRDPANNRITQDPSGESTSFDNSVLALSYARQLPFNLDLGFNYKFYTQSLGGGASGRGAGAGLDLAVIFRPRDWLALGANAQNLSGGKIQWATGEADSLGKAYKIGGAIKLMEGRLIGGLDVELANSRLGASSLPYHLGVEYYPAEKVILRTGLNSDQNGTSLNYGVGLLNGGFRFDYAYSSRSGIPGDSPHYFSLSYVGERVMSVKRQLKDKQGSLRFLSPLDKSITGAKIIAVSAEAKTTRLMDETYIWTVTGVDATSETHPVTEEEPLMHAYFNSQTFEGTSYTSQVNLFPGRNVFQLVGYTSPDAKVSSVESRVLRFDPPADLSMSYWAIEPIALCMTLDLIKGYPDNTFKPEKGISRAELVTLLIRSLNLPEMPASAETISFTDVGADHWASQYIARGAEKEYVTGYPDGSFKPNKTLTRAEGIAIMARYAGLSSEAAASPEAAPYIDLEPAYWGNKFIGPAKTAGLLKYITGEAFNSSAPYTRAEACEVLYRTPYVQKLVEEWWNTGVIATPPIATPEAATIPATSESQPSTHVQ